MTYIFSSLSDEDLASSGHGGKVSHSTIKGARDFGIASALIGTGLTDLGSPQIEQSPPRYLLQRLWEEL